MLCGPCAYRLSRAGFTGGKYLCPDCETQLGPERVAEVLRIAEPISRSDEHSDVQAGQYD